MRSAIFVPFTTVYLSQHTALYAPCASLLVFWRRHWLFLFSWEKQPACRSYWCKILQPLPARDLLINRRWACGSMLRATLPCFFTLTVGWMTGARTSVECRLCNSGTLWTGSGLHKYLGTLKLRLIVIFSQWPMVVNICYESKRRRNREEERWYRARGREPVCQRN